MADNGHAGESEWIRVALERYEGPLLRYALRITGDAERARDVVQETFLKLCRENQRQVAGGELAGRQAASGKAASGQVPSGQAPSQFAAPRLAKWLYTVCRNQAFDVRRKERRMSTLSTTDLATTGLATTEPGSTELTDSAGAGPAEQAERQDAAARVLELVGELPDNQQEVLSLKFQGGMSYREISDVTGLSVSYVGYLIHNGIHSVRQKLKSSL